MSNLFQKQLSTSDGHFAFPPQNGGFFTQQTANRNPQAAAAIHQQPPPPIFDKLYPRSSSPMMIDSRNYCISSSPHNNQLPPQSMPQMSQPQENFYRSQRQISNQENMHPTQLFTQEFSNKAKATTVNFSNTSCYSNNGLLLTNDQYDNSEPVLTEISNSIYSGGEKQQPSRKKDPLDRPLKGLLESAINKAIKQSDRIPPPHSMTNSSSFFSLEPSSQTLIFIPPNNDTLNASYSSRSPLSHCTSTQNICYTPRKQLQITNTRRTESSRSPVVQSHSSTRLPSCGGYAQRHFIKTSVSPSVVARKSRYGLSPNGKSHCLSVTERTCVTPHKRFQSSIPMNTPGGRGGGHSNNKSASKSITATSGVLKSAHDLERLISNAEVRGFLCRHLLAGECEKQLICESWETIPLVYFVKLLIMEFPEVLEDHCIGEMLIVELKERISSLVAHDVYPAYLDLPKLQKFTRLTGLLGLILQGLKDLSAEEWAGAQEQHINNDDRLNASVNNISHNNASTQRPHPLSNASVNSLDKQQGHLATTTANSMILVDKFLLQNSYDQQLLHQSESSKMHPNDLQNIKNILQEFVESLYGEMENEIYSKFNVEMRRLTGRFKETQKLLKFVQERVSDNYGAFKRDANLAQQMKSLHAENSSLVAVLGQRDLKIQQLSSELISLREHHVRAIADNEKLNERCEKYIHMTLLSNQQMQQQSHCSNGSHIGEQFQQLLATQTALLVQLQQSSSQLTSQGVGSPKKQPFGQLATQQPFVSSTVQLTPQLFRESCNLSAGQLTLEDEEEMYPSSSSKKKRSSKLPVDMVRTLSAVAANSSRCLLPADISSKQSIFRVLDIFIQQSQERDFSSSRRCHKKRVGAAERFPLQQQTLSVAQAAERLERMVEILPMIRTMNGVQGDTIEVRNNFLQHFYSLQTFLFEKSASGLSESTTHVNVAVPMNKCWKVMLEEKNISESTSSINSRGGIYSPEDHRLIGVGYQRVINNTSIVDVILRVLKEQLERVPVLSSSYGESEESSWSATMQLRVLVYLNILVVAGKKSDVLGYLARFMAEMKEMPKKKKSALFEFLADNDAVDVVLASLEATNFSSMQVVADSLAFLMSFKQSANHYMTFVKQLASEQNMRRLLALAASQHQPSNIAAALNLIKNVSYSVNFSDHIQVSILQLLRLAESRIDGGKTNNEEDKEISDLVKLIRNNVQTTTTMATHNITSSRSLIDHSTK